MSSKEGPILITGAGGFIGAALVERFLNFGSIVIGIDNLNNYYEKNLKLDRLKNIEKNLKDKNLWKFNEISITQKDKLKEIMIESKPRIIINLAAQAGVRYSLTNPQEYINTNLLGFSNVLDMCKEFEIEHLIYASSSSVYGGNNQFPFKEDQKSYKSLCCYKDF